MTNRDANVGDTIFRQAAIDALNAYEDVVDTASQVFTIRGCKKAITNLPSAQPENIRCYECKHGTHSGCENVYICNVSPELVMKHTGDFYCGYAKRKTDEEVN